MINRVEISSFYFHRSTSRMSIVWVYKRAN